MIIYYRSHPLKEPEKSIENHGGNSYHPSGIELPINSLEESEESWGGVMKKSFLILNIELGQSFCFFFFQVPGKNTNMSHR